MKKILIFSYLFILFGSFCYAQSAIEIIPHPTQDAIDLRLNGSAPMANSGGSPYTTFSAVGNYGCDITSDGSGLDIMGSADELEITNTVSYTVTFDLVLNSGWLPGGMRFVHQLGGSSWSNTIVYPNIVEGANQHTLTATNGGTGALQFYHSSKACDIEIRNLSIIEQ